MSYLSGYIFYGHEHVIKYLNNKNRDSLTVGLQPGRFMVLPVVSAKNEVFNFKLYLVLQFFYESELVHSSFLYFKPVDQRFHRYSL